MGLLAQEGAVLRPSLSPLLVFGKENEHSEKRAEFETEPLLPLEAKSIPDFSFPREYGPGGMLIVHSNIGVNYDYYRDKAEYLRYYSLLRPVRFAVANNGTAVANDVKVVMMVADPNRELEVSHQRKRPGYPETNILFDPNRVSRLKEKPSDVECAYVRDGWRITVKLGKIQAKDTVVSQESLYLGRRASGIIELATSVFSDDLSSPVQEVLAISYVVTPREMSLEQLTK